MKIFLSRGAMTKVQAAVLIAIVAVVVVAGVAYYAMRPPERPFKCEVCGATFETEKELKTHIWDTHPIKIGGSLPLTGVFSETGKWIERGYRYWAEEINAKGGLLGCRVELIIYDDASEIGKAVTYLEKAITVDKVDLLLGGYPGTACDAQMPVAEKYKMVYNSMGGHMWSFERGYKYCFGGPPLMGQWWADGFWKWIETLPPADRPTKAAILSMNNVIGRACRESILWGAGRVAVPVVVDEFYDLPLATADPLVSKAKAAGADVLFANGFFADGVLTIRACKALGYNPKFIFQSVGCIIPEWVKELGKDGDYVFSGTAMHYKLPFPGVAELNKVAKEKFGEPVAPMYFLFGYCWMQVLQLAVEGAGSLKQDAIRDYLRTREISTIGGKFKFDERGLPAPYMYCTQVIDGKVELIWPLDVRTAEPVYPKPAWG
ncbi:MAG: hypothetical protein AOA65_1591 [Candidatus Bathyarchaeota archaeon BA1]|nr:MAG: hypothetical protein AOA65_1591 [Candidatus Bathyarchaeota archaeon BA1]